MFGASSDEKIPVISAGQFEQSVGQVQGYATGLAAQLQNLTNEATLGSGVVRTLAFAGGCYMAGMGGLQFFLRFLSLNAVTALMTIYIILFGLVLMALEGTEKVFKPEWKQKIFDQAKFLQFNWGRGGFIIFCGLSLSLTASWIDILASLYMLGLGGYMVYIGVKSHRQLQETKKQLKDENMVSQKFKQFDADGNGTLDTREFTKFCQDLGIKLSLPELEVALRQMDTNGNGTIELSELIAWYNDLHPDKHGQHSQV
eukprot:CAMPEP_0113938090 /NCGR_PEP_ID=MMETSP1339-20121228/4498_1 /TAXON_ID=94617 /ORGANISM="Fibrocapsa japonica" /LENGTH=256 /DNA_ID=CAMNT_0000941027 /DNA_START=104 /DNA_END=874 /DNA_ORIENTATION=+ /assembly_acc=CAM_ASM_000762